MENRFYDEKNGLWYEKQGDYCLPCLELPEKVQPAGLFGKRYLRYLKEYHGIIYTNLFTSGRLNRLRPPAPRRAYHLKELH